jgi:hypothetical protein
MPESQRLDIAVLSVLRDALNSGSLLSLLEPTRKLAQLLTGTGASSSETHLSSLGMPPGLSTHWSRQTSGAQVTHTGGFRDATPSVPA